MSSSYAPGRSSAERASLDSVDEMEMQDREESAERLLPDELDLQGKGNMEQEVKWQL